MGNLDYQVSWREDLTTSRDDADRQRCNFIYTALNTRELVSFSYYSLDRPLQISILKRNQLSNAVRAYQNIWYYADAYRELWTAAEARAAIDALEDCFVAIDELDQVVALAGGKLLSLSDNPELLGAIENASRTYYFAELGRVAGVKNSRVGAFLFELTMINAIRKGYEEFILITAETGDIIKKTVPNPARKLYESHGYRLVPRNDGTLIGCQCVQKRSNNQMISDWRPYYYTTATAFRQIMGLPKSK